MQVPAYAWVLSVLTGFALSWWAYRFLWSKNGLWKLAAALRFFVVFVCTLWLFKPLINFTDSETKPARWDFYVDVSESNKSEISLIAAFGDTLREAFKNVDLRLFAFGESIVPYDNRETLKGDLTRFDKVLDHMESQRSETQLRCFVSDGLVNQGQMPASYNMSKLGPILTLGTGDVNQYTDVFVEEFLANEEVYQGNSTEIEALLGAKSARGKRLKIEFWVNGKLRNTKDWVPESDREKKRMVFNVTTKGTELPYFDLKLLIKPIDGEKNLTNNERTALVRILDQRKIVDFVYASPHPDIKAMQMALRNNESYMIRAYSESEGIKNDADVYVVHGLKGSSSLDLIKNTNKPVWWFTFNTESLIHVFDSKELTAVKKGLRGFQESVPAWNPKFQAFELLSPNSKTTNWNALETPLLAVTAPVEYVQFYQSWSGVQTNVPLMYSRKTEKAEHVFLGLGIWRWRMNEFRKTERTAYFDNWVLQNIQWLIRSNSGKSGWEFITGNKEWHKGEQQKIKWVFYDEAGEKRVPQNVEAIVEGEGEKSVKLNVIVENNEYVSFVKPEFDGLNRIQLRDDMGKVLNESFVTVLNTSLEGIITQADHDILAEIAKNSGGYFCNFHTQKDRIISKLRSMDLEKSRIIVRDRFLPFEKWPLILSVLVSLLGIEWFIRKWLGKI